MRSSPPSFHVVSCDVVRRLLFPHLAFWVIGLVAIRVVLVPAEVCPSASSSTTRAAAVAAGDWLAVNLGEEGRFTYSYNRATDEVGSGYSIVRMFGWLLPLCFGVALLADVLLIPAMVQVGWIRFDAAVQEDRALRPPSLAL